MAYSKAGEEKRWLLWKEAEEKKLRQSGVDEDTIQKLHAADWEVFKAERWFYEHLADTNTYIDHRAADEPSVTVQTVQDLLDDIDDEKLHRHLLTVDRLTLQIIIWKMEVIRARKYPRNPAFPSTR